MFWGIFEETTGVENFSNYLSLFYVLILDSCKTVELFPVLWDGTGLYTAAPRQFG